MACFLAVPLVAASFSACRSKPKQTTEAQTTSAVTTVSETAADTQEEPTTAPVQNNLDKPDDNQTTSKPSGGGNATKPNTPPPTTSKPQEPTAPPTTSAPKPTEPEIPAPPAGDGKVTQEQRDYMTNKFIEKALEVGFTTAMRGTLGEVTGNYSGEVYKVTPEHYDYVFNAWMAPGGIEHFHKYQGFNQLFVEWKDCGDYWEVYLQFVR